MRQLICFLMALAAAAQTRPDFSGYWRWNREQSQSPGGGPDSGYMALDQTQDSIRQRMIVLTRGKEQRAENTYPLDGPSKQTFMSLDADCVTSWEGPALVVRAKARLQGQDFTNEERFTLSADRKQITYQRNTLWGARKRQETLLFDREPEAAAEFDKPEQRAGAQYKNLKVLAALPASELIPAMMRFQTALGVKCVHCHVENQWEKDDLPAKHTARKMITMVESIRSQANVSCNTCHRGQVKPAM